MKHTQHRSLLGIRYKSQSFFADSIQCASGDAGMVWPWEDPQSHKESRPICENGVLNRSCVKLPRILKHRCCISSLGYERPTGPKMRMAASSADFELAKAPSLQSRRMTALAGRNAAMKVLGQRQEWAVEAPEIGWLPAFRCRLSQ